MKKLNLYIYDQTNSGGRFDDTKKAYVENTVFPVKVSNSFFEGTYNDIGVISSKIKPKMVYFDGVKQGIDCSCFGDRWYEPFENENTTEVYIFDDLKDYENSKAVLKEYSRYCILSEMEEE